MKELTAEEANAVLAEKVMGWRVDTSCFGVKYIYREAFKIETRSLFELWNPATNPAHRDEALEAWQAMDKSHMAIIHLTNKGWYVKLVSSDRQCNQKELGKCVSKSLCTSAVNAILQAIGAGQIGEGE